MEWLVRLVFRVPRNTFKQADVVAQLQLRPLHEIAQLQAYNRETRIKVANRKGPWQEVWMLIAKIEEIQTDGFQQFLKKAVEAFNKGLGRMKLNPEDVMPWKLNGEKWHLGEKGFPPGRKLKWDRALLPRLIAVLREIDPKLEFRWDARDQILIKIAGVGKSWGRIRTKDNDALDACFLGKPGLFNLSRVDGVGQNPSLEADRADGGEVLRLFFQKEEEMPKQKLRDVLKEHLAGFAEHFQR
jgi:excinuclease ABC subunit A